MKTSTDRILTTHVGSLPRPERLAELMMIRERREPYEPSDLAAAITAGTAEIVRRQAATGIDIVNDGEAGKVSYATYVKDRLNGFGGDAFTPKPHLDLAPHPRYRQRLAQLAGAQSFLRLCCTGPISISDHEAVKTDIANLKAALAPVQVTDAFMSAASPGVISSFQRNRYYPTHRDYIEKVAAVMTEEYEAIAAAGFVLHVDCPDLAMSRHTGFQDLTDAEFLKQAESQIEVLNHSLRNVPREQVRLHICWGNYEGPHDHDMGLETILPILLKAKAQAFCFEASNPRHSHEWIVWKEAKLPDDIVLIPGVLDTTTNFVEHPELVAQRLALFAGIVGRERVIAGTDCGFATYVGQNRIDPDIAYKKLASMVEGAARASTRLWGRRAA